MLNLGGGRSTCAFHPTPGADGQTPLAPRSRGQGLQAESKPASNPGEVSSKSNSSGNLILAQPMRSGVISSSPSPDRGCKCNKQGCWSPCRWFLFSPTTVAFEFHRGGFLRLGVPSVRGARCYQLGQGRDAVAMATGWFLLDPLAGHACRLTIAFALHGSHVSGCVALAV